MTGMRWLQIVDLGDEIVDSLRQGINGHVVSIHHPGVGIAEADGGTAARPDQGRSFRKQATRGIGRVLADPRAASGEVDRSVSEVFDSGRPARSRGRWPSGFPSRVPENAL